VMNAGFSNLDSVSDIGVAEPRISEIGDQDFGRLKDAFCGFSLHADETTN
jgi:hypothetical protein